MKTNVFTKNVEGRDFVLCDKNGRVVKVEGDTDDAVMWYHKEFGVVPSAHGWQYMDWEVLVGSSEELYPVCYDLDEPDKDKKQKSGKIVYTNLIDWETVDFWNDFGLPAPDDCKTKEEAKVKFAVFLKN